MPRMPSSRLALPVVLAGVVGLLGACAQQVPIADPRDPDVLAERNRVIRLLATDLDDGRTPGVCQVKVLRLESPTTWAHASCSVQAAADGERTSWATFIRVDGDEVSYPEDGTTFEPSLRELYPADLADWALEHPNGR